MYKSKSLEEGRPFPDYTTLAITVIALIGGILLFRYGFNYSASGTQDGSPNASLELAQASQEINPGVDATFSLGETSMYMPKGATNQAGYVSMTLREPNLYASAGDSGWTRPFVVNYEYQTYPGLPVSGISFFKPVLICFQLNQELWQDYARRSDAYQVEYYAESLFGSRWIVLPRSEKTERLQLCGETHHLSLYAMAILPEDGVPLPLIPITGADSIPTSGPTQPYPTEMPPTRTHDPLSLTAIPPTVPPTVIPTSIGHTPVPPPDDPTAIPTTSVPSAVPTEIVPTDIPTDQPTEIVPTSPPATEPSTEIVPTDPPATEPATEIVPTDPPATDPPPTDPPATDPPATDPPATDPPATDPPATDPPSEIVLVYSLAGLILIAF